MSYVAGSSYISNSKTNSQWQNTVDGIAGAGGYKIGSYAPKGNAYFKFSAKVPANDKLAKCGDNTLTNKAIAFTNNGDKSDTATITVTKDCPPEPPKKSGVSIEKTVDGKEHKDVAVGEEFTYNLTVKNTGQTNLINVRVTDNAPANIQFVSADKGTIVNNKWSYNIPSLKVGESFPIAIKAKVTKYVEGTIKNTACVDAPAVPGTPDDCDDATVEIPPVVPPVVPEIKVCDIDSKKVITIKEDQFDNTKHTKDLSVCTPTTPETPEELPTTGMGEGITAMIGLGSLVASLGYYVASRRSL
jgi:uncharacterized repeat protein (TIGR01451 family)